MKLNGQQAVSASFIATGDVETVIVETYNMLLSNLFGKAFCRYHTDEVFD